MDILSLLILLLLFCLVFWAAQRIMAAFNLPEPIQATVVVIGVILAVLSLIQAIGGTPHGLPLFHL